MLVRTLKLCIILVFLCRLVQAEVQVFCEIPDAIRVLGEPRARGLVTFSSLGPLAIRVFIYNGTSGTLDLEGSIDRIATLRVRGADDEPVRGLRVVRSLTFGDPVANKFEALPISQDIDLKLEPRASLEVEILWWDGDGNAFEGLRKVSCSVVAAHGSESGARVPEVFRGRGRSVVVLEPRTNLDKARSLYLLARRSGRGEDYMGAAGLVEDALKLAPDMIYFRAELGRYRLMAGDYQGAADALEELVRETGPTSDARGRSETLAQAYVGLGREEEAVALLKAAYPERSKSDLWFQEKIGVLVNAVKKRAVWLRERQEVVREP